MATCFVRGFVLFFYSGQELTTSLLYILRLPQLFHNRMHFQQNFLLLEAVFVSWPLRSNSARQKHFRGRLQVFVNPGPHGSTS